MPADVSVELLRRRVDGTLAAWLLEDDGDQPVHDPAVEAKLEAVRALLDGTLDVHLASTAGAVPVSGPLTDAQLRAADVPVRDTYLSFRQPVDQTGTGAVLTFTLGGTCDLVWVLSRGGVSRAAVGVDPAADRGAYCDDGVPTPLTVRTGSVRVFAPVGATVSVWAYG